MNDEKLNNQVEIKLLTSKHNEQLLKLMHSCPIKADFTFEFDRSPDFFALPEFVFDKYYYRGAFIDKRLVGCAGAGLKRGWIGSQISNFAYFGDGRVLPEFRGRNIISQLVYSLLNDVKSEINIAYAIVKQGNTSAFNAVKSFLPSLFEVIKIGTLNVHSIIILKKLSNKPYSTVHMANEKDVPSIISLFNDGFSNRTFAPKMTANDLEGMLNKQDFLNTKIYIAEKKNELQGALILRNFHAMKRTVLLKYTIMGKLLRTFYKTARLIYRQAAPLPERGNVFNILTVTKFVVKNDNPIILKDLLKTVYQDAWSNGYHLITVGLLANSKLNDAIKPFQVQKFSSDIFAGTWKDARNEVHLLKKNGKPFVDLSII